MASYYFSSSTGRNTAAGGTGTAANPWKNFWEEKAGTSALSPGDICYFKAGDTWYGGNAYINVDSNGSSGNPIVFDRYGTGNDPVFTTSSIVTSWTVDGAGTGTYYKTGQFAGLYTVGVDGTSALGYWTGAVASMPAGSYMYQSSTGRLYIRLWDSSNPSGHTIYVPTTYQQDEYRGVIRGSASRGSYVHFKNLKVMYTNGIGFSLSQPYSEFHNCTAVGCGREGFYFNGWVALGEMADNCTAYNCYASYCNARGNGYGQAYTMNSSYCWWVNCTAEYCFKEGFDFLDYSSNTDCHHSGMIYCTSYRNGQDPLGAYDAPLIYVDGAHDILIYGCVAHGAGVGNNSSRNSNAIMAWTEHQDKPCYNIHIINNLLYDARGYLIWISNGGDYPAYNNAPATYGNTIVNNTLVRNSGGYGAAYRLAGLGTSVKTIVKNNVIYSNNTYLPAIWTNIDSAKIDSGYNCYYNTGGSNLMSTSESSSPYTLAALQAIGLETNSINSNPNIINTANATLDAHLNTSTSPCINAGTNSPWTPPTWVVDAGILADDGAVVGSTRADGVVDTGTLDIGYHYYAPTPYGSLTSTNVQPATLYVNTSNTCTITFTTANTLPSDGKVVITFPTTLGGGFSFNSGGTTAATFNSGGSGSLAVSISGATVTLTRSGGSDISASTAVSIALTYVLNPPQVGTTGAYSIQTTTSAGTPIDVDTDVSADQIIEPVSTFKTITISAIRMSNIKFMST
jgi:hypothetical protein